MASSALKNPPVLTDDSNYENWKTDLEVWEMLTDLNNTKKGPALYLSLQGKARECLRELTPARIGGENGFELICQKLDAVYRENINYRTFSAFKTFYEYRRPADTSIKDFIITYESLYHKLDEYNMQLPEGVQAFFILNAANIDDESERLARVTCPELTYNEMKATLLKIFCDPAASNDEPKIPPVKTEPVFKVSHKMYRGNYNRNWGRGRGGFHSNSRMNPTDSEGNVMQCFKCGSKKHFAKYCDKKVEYNKETNNKVYVTLLSNSNKLEGLLSESFGTAVLDTACSRTLTGKLWLEEYKATLSEKDKALMKTYPSDTSFVFGDGKQVTAEMSVRIPVTIGEKSLMINADVVPNQVPLLFSRASMKKGRVVINTGDNTAEILDQKVKLIQTSSGHLCLPLSKKLLINNFEKQIVLNTIALKNCNPKQKHEKAMKLHRQFSHASKEKLIKLVKNSKDFNDEQFINDIKDCCEKCEICKNFKRPPLRPVVNFPLGGEFNQVVCMDLKEVVHNKSWFLHLIDSFSGYSAARIVYSKKKEEIIEKIFESWIAYFGCPQMFLSDNGGEFNNDAFRNMNEQLNIQTATTAGESPFSNGMVEKHNSTLGEALKKTMMNEKCSAELALCWATSAKNALPSYGGVSPNMLVFSRNINVPNILNNKLPAMSSSSVYEVIRKNISALHVAREKYIEAQSSEKIKKALRSKTRTFSNISYNCGDRVFYKRKNVKGWKGPATVIGKDGSVVMLRHGGSLVRAHPCHLMKDGDQQNKHLTNRSTEIPNDNIVETSETDEENDIVEDDLNESDSIEDDSDDIDTGDETEYSDESENELGNENDKDDDIYDEADETNNTDENGDIEQNEVDKIEQNENDDDLELLPNTVLPKRNTNVKFKLTGSNNWNSVKILSSLKKTGKYYDWLNVKYNDGTFDCIHWKTVDTWKKLPNPVNVVYLSTEEELSQKVVNAKAKEIQNLKDNKVFKVVPYTGQKTISSRWVITEKLKDENKGMEIKARLVARGFEENTTNLRKDSPTCSREGLRMINLSASTFFWELETLDFTSAFLQGEAINRNIFLRPPKDVCNQNEVWCLQKCLYGLNDAPRSWYKKVKNSLLELGGKQSVFDEALFLWHDENGKLEGILGMHVDDFVFTGTKSFKSRVIDQIKVTFKIGAESAGSFKYIGLSIFQENDLIDVSQNEYVKNIQPIKLSENRHPDSALTTEEKDELKKLSGQMIWVSSQTRPDLAYETCIMSNQGTNPTVKMIKNANKAVSKLKRNKVSIQYKNIGKPEQMRLKVYSDATHASLSDGSSQGGFVVLLEGSNQKSIPISWQSKRIQRVTKSPLASETLALGDAADAAFLIALMMKEVFGLEVQPPITCITDSSSLVQHLHTTKVSNDRRLRVDMSRLREMVKNQEISVSWCPGKYQLGDCLTKNTASTRELLKAIS